MSDGKTFTTFANRSETIKTKNGVELREVVTIETRKTLCYELYMDGELISKHDNLKTAMSLWKDFSA